MINWNDLVNVLIRSLGSIITLFVMSKMMGRKQISQLSTFDYIMGISIGSIAAQMATDAETEWFHFVSAMAVYVAVYILIAVITVKSLWARKFFEGAPIILIQDGKIISKNLKSVHYEVNSLLEECRLEGYFDINDIQMATMESDGRISLLPTVDKRPVNVGDLKLSPQPEGLVANLIIDGKVMESNLKAIGKEEEWLLKELKKQNIKSPKDVLLATCDVNGKFHVFLKNENINVRHCLE
ncbi:DUF421 domain-containing protein [Cellulosilyticum sp. I15G10I2]|uniref:DUF421 domain-containing protein n=1 Tax=Cellulosilyticum sp. I15G10I2 TaxID=1892843 RepID=UPI00149568A7|nr:DUF421 domain-containing protein [Cellulosilyticum sp. I15G10I2]